MSAGTMNKYNSEVGFKDTCSFCGAEDNANNFGEWIGEISVVCCRNCAIDILPKLIADSIHLPSLSSRTTHGSIGVKVLTEIVAPFWQALECRVGREVRHD